MLFVFLDELRVECWELDRGGDTAVDGGASGEPGAEAEGIGEE